MKKIVLAFTILAFISCSQNKQKSKPENGSNKTHSKYKLELVWESDTLVKTPESVLLDRTSNILYVSCVNQNPWEKDGNGYISKMDKSGNIIDLKWVEGLNGPKGLGISGNSLFVADIDVLVEIDLNSGKIVNKVKVAGKPELNDVTVGPNGAVYVSGSGSNVIYKLEKGSLVGIYKGKDGERLNGLYREKNRMLMLTSSSSEFKQLPNHAANTEIIATKLGHGDGIAPIGDKRYLCSDWSGAIYYISAFGDKIELLNTIEKGENAADIDYSINDNLLFVPTFFKNRVKAYKLVKNK